MPELLDPPAAAPAIVAPSAKASMPPADPGAMVSGRATPPPTNTGKEPAPKKGTAQSEGFDALDKIAGKEVKKPKPEQPKVNDERPDPETTGDNPPEDTDSKVDDAVKGAGDEFDDAKDDKKTEVKTDSTTKPEAKKPNPWRLADEWKKKAQDNEKIIQELKTTPPQDPEKEPLKQRLAAQEKEVKELKDELKFYNYEKHDDEFKTQFDQPYIDAWHSAVEEIAQFPVLTIDPDTNEVTAKRPATAADLLKLVDLPAIEAREQAEKMFGKYAADVLAERKRVREKFDARTKALDMAKKGLNQKQMERQQQAETARNELKASVNKLWEDSNKFATEHPQYGEYFRPVEGDQEGNLRLAKGREMVERAFNEDPNKPDLTPQQRADIVRRHALIFHRAAAFGRTVAQLKAARAKIAAIEKELTGFKASTPGEGEGHKANNGKTAETTGMAGAMALLDRMGR